MGLFREKRMCATCESVGYAKTRERGSTGVELLLWLFFLLPGIIYSVWRRSTKYSVCRTCGSTTLMPLHTAGAQRRMGAQEVLVAEIVDPRTPVIEARAVRDGSTSGWVIGLGCFVAAWFVVAGIVCGSSRNPVRIEPAQAAAAAVGVEPAATPKPKKSAKTKKHRSAALPDEEP